MYGYNIEGLHLIFFQLIFWGIKIVEFGQFWRNCPLNSPHSSFVHNMKIFLILFLMFEKNVRLLNFLHIGKIF